MLCFKILHVFGVKGTLMIYSIGQAQIQACAHSGRNSYHTDKMATTQLKMATTIQYNIVFKICKQTFYAASPVCYSHQSCKPGHISAYLR